MRHFKRIIIIVCALVLTSTLVYAQTEEGFTVSGEITFEKSGNVYVSLITEEDFGKQEHGHQDKEEKQEQHKEEQESPFRLMINVGEEELNAKKVSFTFEHVPAGTYAIRAFQDVNDNGKMDIGTFGPKEPWGNYRAKRPRFRGPKFEEMAFEVKDNITDISIELK